MKSVWIASAIGIVLLFGGIFFNMKIDGVTKKMQEKEERISVFLEEKNFVMAQKEADELTGYIDDKMIVLASVIDHKLIDDIELCVAEIKGYSKEEYENEALVKCKKLEHLISHLPINYRVNLQNIL